MLGSRSSQVPERLFDEVLIGGSVTTEASGEARRDADLVGRGTRPPETSTRKFPAPSLVTVRSDMVERNATFALPSSVAAGRGGA